MLLIVTGIVARKRCARARPVRLRSAIEERAVLGVTGGVGGHEGALRDRPSSVASQRFKNASGLLLTRVGMRSREFIEFRRSLRRSAGLVMLRLNLSNLAATTTQTAATE